jgi:hypothetical protein
MYPLVFLPKAIYHLSVGEYMLAVKGVYDGNTFLVDQAIPVTEKCEVIITFLDNVSSYNQAPIKKENLVKQLSPTTPFHLTAAQKAEQDTRDMEIINRNADRLNKEALDVLEYQMDLF